MHTLAYNVHHQKSNRQKTALLMHTAVYRGVSLRQPGLGRDHTEAGNKNSKWHTTEPQGSLEWGYASPSEGRGTPFFSLFSTGHKLRTHMSLGKLKLFTTEKN